jgi:hypothetical protein
LMRIVEDSRVQTPEASIEKEEGRRQEVRMDGPDGRIPLRYI